MKLCQKIILDADNKLSTSLWPQKLQNPELSSVSERLAGPCELSFHPYILEAWGEAKPLVSNFEFTWDIHIIDDEEHRALFAHLSQNRSLLLLSETFNGLEEIINLIGFSLNYIKPDPAQNLISISMSYANLCSKKALGGALFLRIGLDSLLFVRGLIIESSVLILGPNKKNISIELLNSLTAVLNIQK